MEELGKSREDLAQSAELTPLSGPLSVEQIASHFSRRSDLTYRRIDGVGITAVDLYMSLLTGSLIRNSVFDKVAFHRSDLDGIRAENCTFKDCDFTNCDIRSSVFAKCKFERCDFDGALIDDCQAQDCELAGCSLEGASLTRGEFRRSSFNDCKISRASLLHNKLYECSVANINVGDCTVLYAILRDCKLKDVMISAECVGGVFGISRSQLDKLKISYLGEHEAVPADSDLLKLIYEQYLQRKWSIGQLVLNLNFDLVSTVAAFEAYLSVSFRRFAEFGFVKGDELEFVGDLLEELAFRENLPLLTPINALDWCTALESAIRESNVESSERSGDPFRTFVSRVVLLTNRLMDRLDNLLLQIPVEETNRPICVEASFVEKPIITLPELLNSMKVPPMSEIQNGSELIRSRYGSYVEVVLTTLSSLVALQVFLYLINGCVIQLTELKQRVKMLTRTRAPKTYVELALSNTQHASPIVLSVLPSLLSYVKGLGWLKQASLGGFIASNVKSLREVDCDDELAASNLNRPN